VLDRKKTAYLGKPFTAVILYNLYKGADRTGTEHRMILKTTANKLETLERESQLQHPSPPAGILYVTIDSGSQEYLDWMSNTTQ
jgi:uncharacterized protein involved in tolerance to divalent cations